MTYSESNRTIPSRNQFAGCLIGQAVGNTTGFVVEGFSMMKCRHYVDGVLKSGKAATHGRPPYAFGQYTDDTQLARELLQSIITMRDFDPADYAQRIRDLVGAGRAVGAGYATRESAARLSRGVSWDKSGEPPPSAGNGSAMRAAPVGLCWHDDAGRRTQVAYEQGRITHKDGRCAAGSAAVAGAVALALGGGGIHAGEFLESLAARTRDFSPLFAECLLDLPRCLEMTPDAAAPIVARMGLQSGETSSWDGIPAFVIPSVLWSFYAFLRTPDDYWETICTAIGAGGDTDTTAALAGAYSGARLGLGAIPAELAATVNDQGAWDYNDLVNLTTRAHEIRFGTPQ